jgi:hypothetical protein
MIIHILQVYKILQRKLTLIYIVTVVRKVENIP